MALQGVPPWHTAAEMRAISNFAHWVEGAFIALLAIVALLEVVGRFRAGKQRYLWPLLVLTPGAFLAVILLVPHHGLDLARAQIVFVWNDPQQRQHVFIAFALLAAGGAEFLRRRQPALDSTWLRFIWPSATAAIGLSFLVHMQHGSGEAIASATRIHQILSGLLLSAGLAQAADAALLRRKRSLTFSWAILLLAAAVVLIAYREPAGAYEQHRAHSPAPR